MAREHEITKISEEPWGEWVKTVWSDGRVLLHQSKGKFDGLISPNQSKENQEAAPAEKCPV
jgi:hypothetical protein